MAQKSKKAEVDTIPLLNGLILQADAASLVSSLLSNGESYYYEANAQVDLKHKYFPVLEIGYGGAYKNSNNDINFKTNGLYGRIGVDVNLLVPKKDEKPISNLFLAGIRLGMSSFPYSVTNVVITDNYWGETRILNYPNQVATKIWFEIIAGVRVEISKNLFMGWTVRNKNLLTQDASGVVSPWYIPGYGINGDSNWGFSYVIGYKFLLPNKIRKVETKLKSTNKK